MRSPLSSFPVTPTYLPLRPIAAIVASIVVACPPQEIK